MKAKIVMAILPMLVAFSAPWAEASVSPPWQDTSTSGVVTPWGVQAVGGPASVGSWGVRVYLVDAGADQNQSDLNITAVNPFGFGMPTRGCRYGHTTHAAGIIGARGYGVKGILPGIPMISVSVNSISTTDALGACADAQIVTDPQANETQISPSDIAKALAWVKNDIANNSGGRPGVVNLSISGGKNFQRTFNAANPSLGDLLFDLATPQTLSDGRRYPGAFIAQAAGNQGTDACTKAFDQPSNSDGIMVVGGLDRFGQPATAATLGYMNEPLAGDEPGGTNYGRCVDVWAPSRDVYSTWMGNGQYRYLSGTSMAAPHVAAIAAYLLNADSTITTPAMLETAVRNRIIGVSAAQAPDGGAITLATLQGGGGAVTAVPSVAIGVYMPDKNTHGIERVDTSTTAVFTGDGASLKYGFYGSPNTCYLGTSAVTWSVPGQVQLNYPSTNSPWTLTCGQTSQTVNVTIHPLPTVQWTVNGTVRGSPLIVDSDGLYTFGFIASDAQSCDFTVTNATSSVTTAPSHAVQQSYPVLTAGSPLNIVQPGTYQLYVGCVSSVSSDTTGGPPLTTLQITPGTVIDGGPSGTVVANSATFTFHSNYQPVTFYCSLDGGAFAACDSGVTYPNLANGDHNFQVAADGGYGVGRDPNPDTRSWTVGNATLVTVAMGAPSPNPATSGQAVTLSASVSTSAATGTMAFLDGGATIASCASIPISAGSANCVVSNLSVGTHSLSARYSGDGTYATATSGTVSETVRANLSPATVTLAASPSATRIGTPVTLTANVTAGATGTVDFMDGILTVPGCAGIPLSNGAGTCVIPNLGAGTHPLSVHYSGDSTFGPAVSTPFLEVVTGSSVPLLLLLQ